MTTDKLKHVVLVACCAVLCADACAADKVKFIGTGWDLGRRTPEQILAQADEVAATGLDGVAIGVPHVKSASGKVYNRDYTMTVAFFTKEIADGYVPVFRKITAKDGLRHSFIHCNWCPIAGKRLDWSDNAAWAAFASNMQAIAYLAKKGGLEGILVDPEDYGLKGQFHRAAEDDVSVSKAQSLARQRGREIGRAMFEEFPCARVLMFHLFGIEKSYYDTQCPKAAAYTKGALLPPFMDGIFDVMPPTAVIVDGDENAYGFRAERRDFEASVAGRLTKMSMLLSPENRGKYRAQTSFGFGLYLDAYFREKNRKTGFDENLAAAARATDEYVWIYGEKSRWIDWHDFSCPGWMKISPLTWETRMPGLANALARQKDLHAWAIRTADDLKDKKSANLIAKALVKPATWQSDKLQQRGVFSSVPGAGIHGSTLLRAENVRSGCFMPGVSGLATGDELIAEAYVRGDGSMHLRWTRGGNWEWGAGGVIGVAGQPDKDGWRRMTVYAKVPEGIDGVRLKMDAHDMPGLHTEFSGVAVWRIRSAERENGKEQSK